MPARLLLFIALLWLPNVLAAQRIVAGVGVENDSIVINRSTRDDITRFYGTPDSVYYTYGATYYVYRKQGVTYGFDSYNRTHLVSEVRVDSTNKWCAEGNFCIGSVWPNGNSSPRSAQYYKVVPWRRYQISYYVFRNNIVSISANDRDESGMPVHKEEFDYDSTGEAASVEHLKKIIADYRSLRSFNDSFPNGYHSRTFPAYTMLRISTRERTLECKQVETHPALRCGMSDYDLTLFSLNDTIYYAALTRENETPVILVQDERTITRIQINMRAIYPQLLDSTLSQLHPPKPELHAYGCSEFNTQRPLSRQTGKMVLNRDTLQLMQWLCSGVPEKQAFGLQGLWKIHSEGVRLSDEILSVMQHVAALNIVIFTCRGCVMHEEEIFSDVVQPADIRKQRRR